MRNSCYEGGGNKYCYDPRLDVTYNCHYGSWRALEVSLIDDVIPTEVQPTGPGTDCRNRSGELSNFPIKCYCTSGVDAGKTIGEGEWCRDVRGGACSSVKNTDKVCGRDGKTCIEVETTAYTSGSGPKKFIWSCEGPVKESVSQTEEGSSLIADLKRSAMALDSSISGEVLGEFIIDSNTGMFTEIEEGTYLFEYEGKVYSFSVEPGIVEEQSDGVLIYVDENENGKYDDGEIRVSELAATVEIITIEKNYRYSLKEGLNFISLPYLVSYDDVRTAAGLLTRLNEVYDDAFYSISKFDGRWKIVGENVELYDNNDFQLLPGEGYMIKSKEDIEITIKGRPVKFETESDEAPITFSRGWNLIGLYGTNIKTYTAKSLIQDINADDFTADNVTKWAKEKQMYEGLQISEGEEYGFDYPLNQLESYFVRITEGKGNWQPKLSGNN
jgi:hypothetical protein